MNIKELSYRHWLYIGIGAALLILLILGFLATPDFSQNRIVVDAKRYDLTLPQNQQQFDQLVAANNVLKSGFNFEAGIAQAGALFALQDYKQAELAWKYFIANRPRAIQGYWGLGEIYMLSGDYAKAEANWLMAIEVDTPASYPNSYIRLADLYRDNLPEKSYLLVEILTTAMQKDPKQANYPLLLAVYYQDIGETEAAIQMYRKAIELDPNASSRQSIEDEIKKLQSQN